MLSNPSNTLEVDCRIYGSGVMAGLVRSRDWSQTPLGPIESWSESLRCSVNLMLSTVFPCTFYWGPELIQFYNDAYMPMMGIKHPTALGQRAEECWPEAWEIIGPQLHSVLSHGEIVYRENLLIPVVRHGDIQDVYWTYSYSPIYLPDGQIGGVFVVCHDTTEEVATDKKLRESEARANRILQSIGDAVIVTDAEARIAGMNPVAEALTGWLEAEAKGKPLAEVFHIVTQKGHQPAESPADKVIRLGTVVGLANHTILIAKDGKETFIDDSGAPIRSDDGNLTGIVLVFRDITERRAVEQEREALQQQLEQVMGATTDGILSIDRNWQVTYVNNTGRALTAPSGDLLGRNLWEVFPGMEYPDSPWAEHHHKAMDDRQPTSFEAFYPEPLNAWYSVNLRPAENGVIIFFRDITDEKAKTEALRDSQARLSAIYANSASFIGILTPDGKILDCNRAALQFTNRSLEDLRGSYFWDRSWFENPLRGPDAEDLNCRETLRSLVLQAADGQTQRQEIRVLQSGADAITFDFVISPVRNEEGEVAFLVPEAHDISDLKRIEAELAASKEELRWTIELSTPIPWTADPEGNLLGFSDHWLQLTGLTRDQALHEGWARVPHPDDVARMIAAWTHSMNTGETYELDHRILTASGQYRWIHSRAVARRDESGRILKWYGTAEDIDDRKRTEEALIRSEKLAAVGRLAASIAHEINNPLEAVFNLIYLAEHSTNLDEIHGFIKTSERELRRVSAITNQTLRFYKQSTSPRELVATELIDNVLAIYQGRIANSQIEIRRRDRTQRPVVCFDGEIRQVLLNLVGNAVDAMQSNGGILTLRSHEATCWRTGNRGLRFTVADTGSGMDGQTQARVFEPFFTTKGIGGTGLGLWVSQEIVERHQGRIRLRSRQTPYSGTIVNFFLPFAPEVGLDSRG